MDVDPGPFVFGQLHAVTTSHLNETCQIEIPRLLGTERRSLPLGESRQDRDAPLGWTIDQPGEGP